MVGQALGHSILCLDLLGHCMYPAAVRASLLKQTACFLSWWCGFGRQREENPTHDRGFEGNGARLVRMESCVFMAA